MDDAIKHAITYHAPGALQPSPHNARRHSAEHVDQLAASIEEWGFTMPVLIDGDGVIIAGHGRVLAAGQLGMDAVPCITADGWTDEQKRAYITADNKLSSLSEWDPEQLAEELDAIQAAGFDLEVTGFTDEDLQRLQDDLDEAAFGELGGGAGDDPGDGPGDDEEPDDEGEDDEGGDDMVSLHVPMERAHRNVVYEALRESKQRHGVQSSGHALLAIVEEWRNAQ